jgi:small subunit ribosomal protein S20
VRRRAPTDRDPRDSTVANIKSQIKRNLQNEKARQRNKSVRSELKTRVKAAESAASNGADDAEATALKAISTIDRAATKGVIHKNAAARKKSRLAKRLAAAAAGDEA